MSTVPYCSHVNAQSLDNDHLRYRLLYSTVAEDIAERWTEDGVSLLDLGCGGAGLR